MMDILYWWVGCVFSLVALSAGLLFGLNLLQELLFRAVSALVESLKRWKAFKLFYEGGMEAVRNKVAQNRGQKNLWTCSKCRWLDGNGKCSVLKDQGWKKTKVSHPDRLRCSHWENKDGKKS